MDSLTSSEGTDFPVSPHGEEPEGLRYIEEVESIADSFRYERCEICHADLDRHTIGPDPLGHAHLWCMVEPEDECAKCGKPIAQADGVWFHTRSGLPPCDPSQVDPEAYTDIEGDKYDIATPKTDPKDMKQAGATASYNEMMRQAPSTDEEARRIANERLEAQKRAGYYPE